MHFFSPIVVAFKMIYPLIINMMLMNHVIYQKIPKNASTLTMAFTKLQLALMCTAIAASEDFCTGSDNFE